MVGGSLRSPRNFLLPNLPTLCNGDGMATDTLTPWTALTPSRKKAVRIAAASMDAAMDLTQAADHLARDFPGNETIGYHIARMLNEAQELMDDAHDSITPDEYEAFCDRQGA
jgi:hypothetical protein